MNNDNVVLISDLMVPVRKRNENFDIHQQAKILYIILIFITSLGAVWLEA